MDFIFGSGQYNSGDQPIEQFEFKNRRLYSGYLLFGQGRLSCSGFELAKNAPCRSILNSFFTIRLHFGFVLLRPFGMKTVSGTRIFSFQ
jgi:hypothetical protein